MIDQRYERNIPSISEAEQALLSSRKVLVLGCGGLGGYLLEYLARLGIGQITAVDGDIFEAGNLNRQLYSAPHLIGHSKAEAAARRISIISPDTMLIPVRYFFNEKNADQLVAGQDLVFDALDNLSSRFLMEEVCERQQVTFIHGAITGWHMQAAVGRPGRRILHQIYTNHKKSISSDMENLYKTSLPMTPAMCAAIQVSEALKLLTGQEPSLDGKMLLFNLKTMKEIMIPL